MTSSQAHKAFVVAFSAFKDKPAWKAVGQYLFGPNWREELLDDEEPAPAEETLAPVPDPGVATGSNDDTGDPLNPPSIQVYVANFIVPEDQEELRSAINFVKKYVFGTPRQNEDDTADAANNEESASSSEEDFAAGTDLPQDLNAEGYTISSEKAKAIVETLETRQRHAVTSILSDHVMHVEYRKNGGKRDLIAWLQEKNSKRNYLFYKANGLRDLVSARSFVLPTGQKTIPHMIDALAGVSGATITSDQGGAEGEGGADNLSSPEESAILAILEKSFLPHQKGKLREYCSLGQKMELPNLKHWLQAVRNGAAADEEDAEHSHAFSGISVEGAYSAGLAARKGATYAKDSVDFVLMVHDEASAGDRLVAWGFEAKGRLTAATAAQEQRNRQSHLDRHVRINNGEVHAQVKAIGERFQVLQHAFVYDFPVVVLSMSDLQAQPIRSIIIDFSTELKEDFGEVLKDLFELSLQWAYPTLTQRPQVVIVPEHILAIADTIKTINGRETLQGTANLWLAMCKLQKPFPSFNRMIPAIYAFWNAVKGGSDTTTKLMDDCVLRVPKSHLNAESAACNRVIMITFVLCHRLFQIFSADPELNYPSLHNYRAAASARTTFHQSLLQCYQIFRSELQTSDDDPESGATMQRPETNAQNRRTQPSRQRVDGVVPEQTTFGATLPMNTPKKIGSMLRRGHAPDEIQKMVHECTGIPLKAHPHKERRCTHCEKGRTAWYCAGCKRWFCMQRRNTSNNPKKIELYSHLVNGEMMTFQKSCYQFAHEAAWGRFGRPETDTLVVSP